MEHPAPSWEGVRRTNHGRSFDRRDVWVGLKPTPRLRTNRTCPGSIRKTSKEAKGKHSFKSTEKYVQKVLDTTDIVRDDSYRPFHGRHLTCWLIPPVAFRNCARTSTRLRKGNDGNHLGCDVVLLESRELLREWCKCDGSWSIFVSSSLKGHQFTDTSAAKALTAEGLGMLLFSRTSGPRTPASRGCWAVGELKEAKKGN